MRTLLAPFVGVAFLAFGFVVLERVFGRRPPRPLLDRSRAVDVAHGCIAQPAGRAIALVAALAAVVAWLPLVVVARAAARLSPFALERLPVALQAVVALVLADFVSYWIHRAFHHVPALWRLHAVHHSSRELDWLSSLRNHPLAEALARALGAVPLVVVGVDPKVVAGIAPLLGLWAILLHANVPWGFGPLRWVIATPLFHRWHHSAVREAIDKNFAGLFPVWDLLFGTWYVPVDAAGRTIEPTVFGVADGSAPEGFVAQLVEPLRSRPLARRV